MDEYLIDGFKTYFPSAYKDTVEMYPGDDEYILIAKLKNDRYFIYDSVINSGQYVLKEKWDNRNHIMKEREWKKKFGMTLSRMIAMRGIRQYELAEMTGVSEVMISKYTYGEVVPSFYNAYRIAKALDIDISRLGNFERRPL